MGNEQEPSASGEERRRFPAARLRRPETEPDPGDRPGEGDGFGPAPSRSRSPFAPRSFAGGRVQVFGCSPAFLVISLVASIVLTLLLNLVIGLF